MSRIFLLVHAVQGHNGLLFQATPAMEGPMGSMHRPSFIGFYRFNMLDNDVSRLVLHPILTLIFCKSKGFQDVLVINNSPT